MGPQECRVEGDSYLPHPAGHASLDAAQDMVGFWAARALRWLMSRFPSPSTTKYFSSGPCSILTSPFVLIAGVDITQVQDLTLGFVEPHDVHLSLLLTSVYVSLDGISSPSGVSTTPHSLELSTQDSASLGT